MSGKYDQECTEMLIETLATGVLLCVLGGTKGSGFSVAATNPSVLAGMAEMLEGIAADIRKDLKAKGIPCVVNGHEGVIREVSKGADDGMHKLD